MNLRINNEWDNILKDVYRKPYFINLEKFIFEEYNKCIIYPKRENIFSAFHLTSFENVKVVILGQDPYHNRGQAHGLVFSVPENTELPPSLKNIYKELSDDLKIIARESGNLEHWAKQGVLLLNAILTVRENEPLSHKNKGWELFIKEVISLLNTKAKPVVFILWGRYAQSYANIVTAKHHLIISGPHPSPLSAFTGFFGGKYFSRCNDFLGKHNMEKINWQ